jgi:hypothetical protein
MDALFPRRAPDWHQPSLCAIQLAARWAKQVSGRRSKTEVEMMTKLGSTTPGTTKTSAAGGSSSARAERLAEALKANLRRRKIQMQERARNRAAEAGEMEAGAGKQTGQESGNNSTDTNYDPSIP